jgi:hypothetical protein
MTRPAEIGAVAETDATLLELRVRVLEPEGGDVEPGEEARLRTLPEDDAGHGLQFLLDEVEVTAEVVDAPRRRHGSPWSKADLGGDETEHVLVERQPLQDAAERVRRPASGMMAKPQVRPAML